MHTTIEIVRGSISELKGMLKSQNDDREELFQKLASRQTEINHIKYRIGELESELKSLEEITYGKKYQGECDQVNTASVSRGPVGDKEQLKAKRD